MKIEISHLEIVFKTPSIDGIGPTAKLFVGPGIWVAVNDHLNGVITGIEIFNDVNLARASWEALVKQNIETATMNEEEED